MKLTITIDLDNAAFEDNGTEEIAAILADLDTRPRPQSRTWLPTRTAPQRPPKTAAEYLRRLREERPTLGRRLARLLAVCFTHRTP